jgi:hypothetical protein
MYKATACACQQQHHYQSCSAHFCRHLLTAAAAAAACPVLQATACACLCTALSHTSTATARKAGARRTARSSATRCGCVIVMTVIKGRGFRGA